METPRVKDLVAKAGISKSYASAILTGAQKPSLRVAAHIFITTGWPAPLIADLTDEQITALSMVYPWERAA